MESCKVAVEGNNLQTTRKKGRNIGRKINKKNPQKTQQRISVKRGIRPMEETISSIIYLVTLGLW